MGIRIMPKLVIRGNIFDDTVISGFTGHGGVPVTHEAFRVPNIRHAKFIDGIKKLLGKGRRQEDNAEARLRAYMVIEKKKLGSPSAPGT